ncbi:MAG: response regulator [Proteobacteria bacterium]|nr:response regulator [Pseudomonadota bacterium]
MSKTILLADPSLVIQKLVRVHVGSEGVQLITVDSAAEAAEKARETQPALVMTAIKLPDGNGYDVIQQIKAEIPSVASLLLIGPLEPFDEARAQEVGADAHITKPFEAQALVNLVSELLERAGGAGAPAAAPAAAAAPQPQDDDFDFFDQDLDAPADDGEDVEPLDPNALTDSGFAFGTDDPMASSAVDLGDPLDLDLAGPESGNDRTVAMMPEDPPPAVGADPLAPPPTSPAGDGFDLGLGDSLPSDPLGESLTVAPDPARAQAEATIVGGEFDLDPSATLFSDDTFGRSETAPPGALDPSSPSGLSSSNDPAATVLADDLFSPSPTPPVPAPGEDLTVEPPAGDPAPFDFDLDGPDPGSTATQMGTPADPGQSSVFDVSLSELVEPEPPAAPVAAPSPPPAPPVEEDDPLGITPPGEGAMPPLDPDPLAITPPGAGTAAPVTTPDVDLGIELDSLAPPAAAPAAPPAQATASPEGAAPLSDDVRQEIHDKLEKIAWEAFSDLSEVIVRQVIEKVEKVAWEVVPQMAETLVQEEIRRMKGEDQ